MYMILDIGTIIVQYSINQEMFYFITDINFIDIYVFDIEDTQCKYLREKISFFRQSNYQMNLKSVKYIYLLVFLVFVRIDNILYFNRYPF